MISTDLRSLTSALKAHYDNGVLEPSFFRILLQRLREIGNEIERLEATPVPAMSRGCLVDGDKVVALPLQPVRGRAIRHPKGGDAA
jgi:hypothetical protein